MRYKIIIMKTNPSFVRNFLLIVLWISLIFSGFAIGCIVIFVADTFLNLNLDFIKNMDIHFGDEEISYSDLKSKGKANLFLLSISAVYYLSLIIQLILTAIRTLRAVDMKNPFSTEIARNISKMGTLALQIGILNIVLGAITELVMHGNFKIQLDLSVSNFLVFAAVLYLIADIFSRGVELQADNDLTI